MEGMTYELLVHYLSGFPKQFFWALIPFFFPLEKKKRWYLYALILWAMISGWIALGTVTFPALTSIGLSSQAYFGLHYVGTMTVYAVGLFLMCWVSWQEAAYAVPYSEKQDMTGSRLHVIR